MQVHRGLRPRRDRSVKGVTGREIACKTMPPVDAWLNSGKIAVFSGIFAGATGRPVPCAGGHKSGSVRGYIFPDYRPREAASGLNPMAVKISLSSAA